MPHFRFVPLVLTAIALSGSIVSAAPVPQAAVTPQQPTVAGQVFRADSGTGALIPLESTSARKEGRGWDSMYCYLEGAHSPVTVRTGEPLVFTGRVDVSPKYLELVRHNTNFYVLEFLFVSADGKRYATKKFVPMEGGPYGEAVLGVNPKKPKDAGQTFVYKPVEQLQPGEYAVTVVSGILEDYPPACAQKVWAFRIVEGAPQAQPAPPTAVPTPPTQGLATATNSPAEIVLLHKSAEQGDVAAQFSLAHAYATGNGVPLDYQLTYQWLRKAADQGSADAQYWLGVMYRDAVGVGPDQAQAAQFFRKAAEQGHSQAQANLGNLHFFGGGVVQDYVEAHKWLNIASARLGGDEQKQCVELRDKVAGLMTPAQLGEAQKRAVDWLEAFQQKKP